MGSFWFSWGSDPPPSPPEFEGLCNQVVFSTRTTKLPATVAFLSSFLVKNIAIYRVAKVLRNQTVILSKTHKTI